MGRKRTTHEAKGDVGTIGAVQYSVLYSTGQYRGCIYMNIERSPLSNVYIFIDGERRSLAWRSGL